MNTPQRLRELREKSGMTPQQVANAIGVDRTTITKYETGGSKPTRSLQKLAELYNVSTDYILGNDVPASSTLPPLTPKDERNIQKKLDDIVNDLSPDSGLAYYNGDAPMTDEDKELLRISMENTLRLARQMAKQKFTPKNTVRTNLPLTPPL